MEPTPSTYASTFAETITGGPSHVLSTNNLPSFYDLVNQHIRPNNGILLH